jgi:hypothetical protein
VALSSAAWNGKELACYFIRMERGPWRAKGSSRREVESEGEEDSKYVHFSSGIEPRF